MSDNERRPIDPNGPGYPATYTRVHYSSSRTVPIYVLFLIMLGSGVFTLLFLWVCVQYIYYKRRMRRATHADVEEFPASAPDAKELAVVSKCDHVEELTYVVMAGEETPTFLARPLMDLDPPPPPPPIVDAAHAAVSSDQKDES